jgi:predicted NAD/FAD-binding protein
MPREWNSPVRECWNAPIHQILKAIDNHTRLYLQTGDCWHIEQASKLREYVQDLKDWVIEQEGKSTQED